MSRATIYRIVGIAFLAFAALSIYRGEYGVGRSGTAVITRAQDPDGFWRGVVIQIATGGVLLYLSRSGRSQSTANPNPFAGSDPAQQAGDAAESLKLPNYDPVFCARVLTWAARVCIGLIVAELLVLLFVHPSNDRCPGWIFHPGQPSAVSMWFFAGMFTVLPALWIGYVARHWDGYYARKMYDSLANGPPQGLLMDSGSLVVMVSAAWCLFCAIPLFMMLGQCTALSHYLSLFR